MNKSVKILIVMIVIFFGFGLGYSAAFHYISRNRDLVDGRILLPRGKMGEVSVVKAGVEGAYDVFIEESKIAVIDNTSEETTLNIVSQHDANRSLVTVRALNSDEPSITAFGEKGVSFELKNNEQGTGMQCFLRKADEDGNILREFIDETGDGSFDIQKNMLDGIISLSYWDKDEFRWGLKAKDVSQGGGK